MKKLIVLISSVTLLALPIAQAAVPSANNKQVSTNKNVDVKCYVSLIDGSEGIYYWHISTERYSNMSKWLPGSTVSPQKTNKRVKVYKVHECVLENSAFKANKANDLEDKTPR